MNSAQTPLISVVCAARNEASNLDELYKRIAKTLEPEDGDWELIVVDDHSTDETFAVLSRLAAADNRVHGVRFSRGFGSHLALLCGLRRARGQCAALIAGDLQDPPELLSQMLRVWRDGAQVVHTVRTGRPGEHVVTRLYSRAYLWLVRTIGGAPGMESGTYLLLDRRVIDALGLYREHHLSLYVLISWMGFRRASVQYVQAPRLHGSSNWTLNKKAGLMKDSLMSHSFFAPRLLTAAGALATIAGIGYGVWIAAWRHVRTAGGDWRVLIALALGIGGAQILMTGILGEYLWSGAMDARRRPQYLIEESTPDDGDDGFGATYP